MVKVSLILACTFDGGIGINNEIPWYIKEDLRKFKKITTRCADKSKMNAVIMGRSTWESINNRLSNRVNIVVTRDRNYKIKDPHVIIVHSIISALSFCDQTSIENIFIIGGTSLYNTFLQDEIFAKMVECIYLSMMFHDNTYTVDKYIDIEQIYKNFSLMKDYDYQEETDRRLFASYICIPRIDLHKDLT